MLWFCGCLASQVGFWPVADLAHNSNEVELAVAVKIYVAMKAS